MCFYFLKKTDLPLEFRIDFPVAIVLVSCSLKNGEKPNLIAVAAISPACTDPPMFGISIGHMRYTHQIISQGDSFVVNVPSRKHIEIVDYCGSVSGRNTDKFKACKLTPFISKKVSSPGIFEFPINIECKIRNSAKLGSHTFYFGEVMAVHCDRSILDNQGNIDKTKLNPLCSFRDSYWKIGDPVLEFGEIRDLKMKIQK
jgi:flavin reductase (DIM6/NTAB) family NADH-FMN oxidoreductase RutF